MGYPVVAPFRRRRRFPPIQTASSAITVERTARRPVSGPPDGLIHPIAMRKLGLRRPDYAPPPVQQHRPDYGPPQHQEPPLRRDNSQSRGLPRAFGDDRFFQPFHHRNSPSAEFFNDFQPQRDAPQRRFGSNQRLFDDGNPDRFWDDFDRFSAANMPAFEGTLPRQSRPASAAAFERPVFVHRQQQQQPPNPAAQQPPPSPRPPTTPRPTEAEASAQQSRPHEQSPKATRTHSNPPQAQRTQSNPPQQPHVINVHPAAAVVEINNSAPSSYTNGKLNPDRQQPPPQYDNVSTGTASDSLKSEAAASDYSSSTTNEVTDPQRTHDSSSPTSGAETMNSSQYDNASLSAPSEERAERGKFQRRTSIDGCSDRFIQMLDEAEARVEQLRETASKLEIEKDELLGLINNLKMNSEVLKLGDGKIIRTSKVFAGERDDLNATADRILNRCKAVDVVVNTPRSLEQTRALDEVNSLIQTVTQKMQEDLSSSKDTVQRFLNACSPDEPHGPIDQRFQSKVVECTADDQKKIRRRLAQMIAQIDRAERTCIPTY